MKVYFAEFPSIFYFRIFVCVRNLFSTTSNLLQWQGFGICKMPQMLVLAFFELHCWTLCAVASRENRLCKEGVNNVKDNLLCNTNIYYQVQFWYHWWSINLEFDTVVKVVYYSFVGFSYSPSHRSTVVQSLILLSCY